MTNSKTRSFRYKASRDIFFGFIGLAFVLISVKIWLTLTFLTFSLDVDLQNLWTLLIYVIIAGFYVLCNSLEIYTSTFKRLSIETDKIEYSYGWLSKNTILIPINKIRSCKKSSGVLQRFFGTMDIEITTAGDSEEIYFSDIEEGEEAYRLISEMLKNNKSEM